MEKDQISTEYENKIKELEELLEVKNSQYNALRNANEVLESQLEKVSTDLDLTRQYLKAESEKKEQLKAALNLSEEKYQLHFENVTQVIYSIDAKFRIRHVSPSVEKEWGYRPEELIGKQFAELKILTPKSLESASSNAMRVFSGEQVPPATYEFVAKGGAIRHGEVITTPIRKNDMVVEIICIAKNMTERLRIEEEILEKQKLQGVIEMARTVSYELNQPIQAIFSHTELMMMEIDRNHPAHEKAETIRNQVYALARLIKQLSNTTKYKLKAYADGETLIDIRKASQVKTREI